jgi:DNA repair exonuclease SbcCD nuclease subunit
MVLNSKKICCFSDIHLGLGQDNEMWHNVALNFAKWASDIYKNNEIDEIIIPGDIFHNRSQISVETLSVAKKFFDYFKEFKIIISAGNHDSFLKNTSLINSISILDGWNNITIVDKEPLLIKTNIGKTISLVPWGVDIEQMPKSDIMFGHFEINSFHMNSYKICEYGMTYSNLLKKANTIISGHFHKKDHKVYDNGQIIYLGSPYQHNFGDMLDSRGIYIFDIQKESFDFIENNVSPKHYKIYTSNYSQKEKDLKKLIENNIVSVVVDTKIEQDDFMNIYSKISKLNPLNVRSEYEEIKKQDKIEEQNDYNSGNLLKDIEDYIDTMDIENKKEVAEYIKQMYTLLT